MNDLQEERRSLSFRKKKNNFAQISNNCYFFFSALMFFIAIPICVVYFGVYRCWKKKKRKENKFWYKKKKKIVWLLRLTDFFPCKWTVIYWSKEENQIDHSIHFTLSFFFLLNFLSTFSISLILFEGVQRQKQKKKKRKDDGG